MSLLSLLLKKKKTAKKIGLALGGGGARGIAHIAFLNVLDDLGLKPSIISGASMGALMGALYASGMSGRQIERTFRDLNLMDMITLVDFSWHTPHGLIKGEKITKTLQELTKHKDFNALDIPLRVVATDFWDRKEVIFEKGDVAKAVRASISLPAIFEPTIVDGRLMVDGGLLNSLPYELLKEHCDIIIAINVLGEKRPKEDKSEKPKFFEAILSAFEIFESAVIEHKLMSFRPDIYVEPSLKNIELLDFHMIDEILAAVKDDARHFKQQLSQLFDLAEEQN